MKRAAAYWFVLCLVPMVATALEEGFDYQLVVPPVPVQNETPGRVEVVELFWYGCPHCFHFEPILVNWASHRPATVDFVRIPAIFQESWEPLARAFYTAEILGVLERVHSPLFQAVQVEHRRLDTEAAIRVFFIEQGVSGEDFDRTFHSFGVENRLNRAKDLTHRYGIDGVPAVIVNGKYRTSGTLTGGLEKVSPVIESLIRKEMQKMTTTVAPAPAPTASPSAIP